MILLTVETINCLVAETEADETSEGEIEAGGGLHFFFSFWASPSCKSIHLELMPQQENNGATNLIVILHIAPPLSTLAYDLI